MLSLGRLDGTYHGYFDYSALSCKIIPDILFSAQKVDVKPGIGNVVRYEIITSNETILGCNVHVKTWHEGEIHRLLLKCLAISKD